MSRKITIPKIAQNLPVEIRTPLDKLRQAVIELSGRVDEPIDGRTQIKFGTVTTRQIEAPALISAPRYYIDAVDGTAIKNSTGTMTVRAAKVDSTGITILSSGNIKMYRADGTLAGNGYTWTADSDDISASATITLKDSVTKVVWDTLTLIDVADSGWLFDTFAVDRSVVAADAYKFLISTSAVAVTATIMEDEFAIGDHVSFYQFGAGQLTIAPENGNVTINTPSTLLVNEQYGTVVLVMEDANQWFIAGRLKPTLPMSLVNLSDVVSAANTSPFVLVADGINGYVGRALVAADISDFTTASPTVDYGVDDSTTALLRFNETSGSTSTTDETGGHTPVFSGDAVISDAVQLSGGTNTLLLDGTGDYVSLPTHADFNFGTSAFTVEFWFYRKTDVTGNIMSWGSTTQGAFYVTAGDTILHFQTGGTERLAIASAAPIGAWVHVALVRDGAGTDSVYVGGDLQGTDTANDSFDQAAFEIGRRVGGSSFDGHIDLLRVSDVARYAADFTPPLNDTWLGTGIAEVNDLTDAVVWDDIPIANVPTGITGVTVALGDHLHTGVYEPADATILKNADISNTVQAWSAVLDNTTASYTAANAATLASALQAETSHADVVVDGDFSSDGFLKRSGGSGSYTVDSTTYATLAENTFIHNQHIEMAVPLLELVETGVTADNSVWQLRVQAEGFKLRAINDARNAAGDVFFVSRTGTVVDSFDIKCPTTIDQSVSNAAVPVLKLDQGDADEAFINFVGTSAADGSASISSDTTTESTKFGAVGIEVNGVKKWLRVYDDES